MNRPVTSRAPVRLRWVLLYLAVLTVVLRFPFWFVDTINWDESTYILLGQALVDWAHPSVVTWGFRSFPYALAIALLGKSIVSIRIAGALCVFVTAIGVYKAGERLWSQTVGLVAGTFWVFMASMLTSGQATMSEHFATVPLVWAFVVLATRPPTGRTAFVSGVLVALAGLVRLNLGYAAIVIGIWMLLWTWKRENRRAIVDASLYAAGGILVLALSFLPYLTRRNPASGWIENFSAGISYATSQFTVFKAFLVHLSFIWSSLSAGRNAGLNILFWIGGFSGLLWTLARWKGASDTQRRGLVLAWTFLLGVSLSIVVGGAAYAHYQIQLAPFVSLGVGLLFAYPSTLFRRLLGTVVVVALALSLSGIAWAYRVTATDVMTRHTPLRGPAYDIAAYLRQNNPDKAPIYIMDYYHIAYWLTGENPPRTSVVHPGAIAAPYYLKYAAGPQATVASELRTIFEMHPRFVVKAPVVDYLEGETEGLSVLDSALTNDYRLAKVIDGQQIYERLK